MLMKQLGFNIKQTVDWKLEFAFIKLEFNLSHQ